MSVASAVPDTRSSASKYIVFGLLYLGWCIAYIDRVAINLALASIGKDLHLSHAALGVVLSSFFIAYAVMQIPGGWLADRFGSKRVVMVGLGFWSIFTILTGSVWSIGSLIVVRCLFGLGEGSFPCASFKGIPEHFPKAQRPKMVSLLVSSNYVGSAITPLLVVPLLLSLGWRGTFHAVGLFGIAFVIIYALVVKKPSQSPDAESSGSQRIGFRELLARPLMWQLVLVSFCLGLVNKGLDSWMPTYLLTVRHIDLKAVGVFTAIPFICAGVSTAISGWVMDTFFDKKEKNLLVGASMLSVIFMYLMYSSETVGHVVLFQSLLYFFKTFVIAAALALVLKLFPGHIVGSATGLLNTGGQAAGFISPLAIGLMVTMFHGSFHAAFIFLTLAACGAVVVSLTIRNRT